MAVRVAFRPKFSASRWDGSRKEKSRAGLSPFARARARAVYKLEYLLIVAIIINTFLSNDFSVHARDHRTVTSTASEGRKERKQNERGGKSK